MTRCNDSLTFHPNVPSFTPHPSHRTLPCFLSLSLHFSAILAFPRPTGLFCYPSDLGISFTSCLFIAEWISQTVTEPKGGMILNVQMHYRQIHKLWSLTLSNWYFKTYKFLPSCMTACLKLRGKRYTTWSCAWCHELLGQGKLFCIFVILHCRCTWIMNMLLQMLLDFCPRLYLWLQIFAEIISNGRTFKASMK